MSKVFELRWRDLDLLGHVYQAVYATLLDEARSQWVAERLPHYTGDYVLARLEIDYVRELRLEDSPVTVGVAVERLGTKSVTFAERVTAASGFTAANARSTIVMWDAATRAARAITDAERKALA